MSDTAVSNEAIISAYEELGSKAAAARALNLPVSTYKDRLKKAKEGGKGLTTTNSDEPVVKSPIPLQTVEQIAESSGISLDEYEVTELYASGDRGVKTVRFRRTAPKGVSEAIQGLLEDLSSRMPTRVAEPKRSGDLLIEMGLVDVHFGKLCWGTETGTDYDLEIAEKVYANAVEDILMRVSGLDIGKFVFPIGSDFFQANNWAGTTAKGTVVDHVDDRMQKVFQAGCRAVWSAVEYCRQHADVELIWVPGNHDPEVSWYMIQVLSARFRDDPHVTVDDSPPARKWIRWGRCLLGMTHGDKEKHDKLPLLMADHPDWSECDTREIHVGHLHQMRQTSYTVGRDYNGATVRILPSLSGTDRWHFENGYTGNRRAAEAHVLSKTQGYWGTFSVNVREDE